MIAPIFGIPIVMVAFGALLFGIRLLGTRVNLRPEVSRKVFHVGMGLVSLCLPWLFHQAWPVFVLGLLAGSALLGIRIVPQLRGSLGTVLHDVERTSRGEFYFIAGVTLLFVLAGRNTILYIVPLLWLTFADTAAALIGARHGAIRYLTQGGSKSVEGSFAFAIVAFVTAFIALAASGHADALSLATICAIASILSMLLEAVVWDGFDNFAIPIFGYALLAVLERLDLLQLLAASALPVALLCCAILYLYLRRPRLQRAIRTR